MQKEIDDLLAVWADAERTGDTATLDTLLADDFVGIGPVGFVLDKSAWLSRFELGLHYDQIGLDDDRRPQVAAMQYSFIGPPLGAPR